MALRLHPAAHRRPPQVSTLLLLAVHSSLRVAQPREHGLSVSPIEARPELLLLLMPRLTPMLPVLEDGGKHPPH